MKGLLLGVGLSLLLAGVDAFEQPSSRLRKPLLPGAPPAGSVPQTDLLAGSKAKAVQPSPTKGYAAVIGGVLIHLACGSMYCWGNLISYLPAHLKYWSPEGGTGTPDAQLVLAFILMSQMTGMPFGPMLESLIGPRLTAMLGATMMGSGLWLASYAKTLLQFVVSYAVLFGLGVGVAYQMPFITGGRWFPGKKGTVQGAIISGMGASAFIFNMVATRLINPEGLNSVGGVFPPEVSARWSPLLRVLGTCYAALALTGAALQSNPSDLHKTYPVLEFFKNFGKPKTTPLTKQVAKKKTASAPPSRSVMSDVCSAKFLQMWLMILTSAVSGLNIAASYKSFGAKQEHLNSDGFLSLVGSLSAILGNAAGRFFWGSLSDSQGFARCFRALTAVQAVTMLLYRALAASRLTFALGTVLLLFCMGGNFAMFPAQTFRTFGANGAGVYSFLFTGFGCAALLGPVLSNKLFDRGGYALIYNVLAALSLFSFTLATWM